MCDNRFKENTTGKFNEKWIKKQKKKIKIISQRNSHWTVKTIKTI